MQRARGFSLIETLIVMALAGVALSIAIPSFQETMTSARTKGVAESIQGGLMTARSEAIKRNAPMRFQLVTALDSTCAMSSATRLWVVTQYTGVTAPTNSRGVPSGQCGINAYLPHDQEEACATTASYTGNAASCAVDPFIAAKSVSDAMPNVDVLATPAMVTTPTSFVVTFGPLGQLLANLEGAVPAGSPAYTLVVSPSSGVTGRSYQVLVNSNGSVRLCAPAAAAGTAMAC
jgi:prepilin-type N-terminal cleavage/methylation domain-containing protein